MRSTQAFEKLVALKYRLYNGLFLTLPFPLLEKTGIKLPLFSERCKEELSNGSSIVDCVDRFFSDVFRTTEFTEKMQVLFLFAQLIERQIVLFDALEEAAFSQTKGVVNEGTLPYFLQRIDEEKKQEDVVEALKHYQTRVVLTAHPTQFYPETVLGIIQDLVKALKADDLLAIEQILLQLGKTSFRNTKSPTPLLEAQFLLSRSHSVFYKAMLELELSLQQKYPKKNLCSPHLVLGFWPGADRDGNPFVTAETTKQVAQTLKTCALNHYEKELSSLKKRLTFPGIDQQLAQIKKRLYTYKTPEELLKDVEQLKTTLQKEHQGLFVQQVEKFILAITLFGFHFACLDLRQDSSVHQNAMQWALAQINKSQEPYSLLDAEKKQEILEGLIASSIATPLLEKPEDPLVQDVLSSLTIVQQIQQNNGEAGLNRYIISNTTAFHHLLEVLFLAQLTGYTQVPLDIIPLFETVEGLVEAENIMKQAYNSPMYRQHLSERNDTQVVMCGFSDGTKDGGYLTCNWKILQAKERLQMLSQRYGITVIFFDGRGGPPARGGGNTHRFYRAMGSSVQPEQIQLTLQGQTISSNYGTNQAAQYNLEQLFTAGLEARTLNDDQRPISGMDSLLLDDLSEKSYKAYMALRKDPAFVPFLEEKTPLKQMEKLNVASRPVKRGEQKRMSLEDLRAIPFVSAWGQIKLNVPGFYGLGTALEWGFSEGRGCQIIKLYEESLFFRTVIDNAMQAIAKSCPDYTKHLLADPKWKGIVAKIHEELEKTKKYILKTCKQETLLAKDPINAQSISLRENLILPLVVIQQYAMSSITDATESEKQSLEKLIVKTMPSIINAGRNSA